MADKAGDALLLLLSLGVFHLDFLFYWPLTSLPVNVQTRDKYLVLLTYPGQYGSVSGDGACFASDDLGSSHLLGLTRCASQFKTLASLMTMGFSPSYLMPPLSVSP